METQHNLARVLREVESGHEVAITRRKKIVARLVPPLRKGQVAFPDFADRAQQIWGSDWQGAGTEELLAESRGDQ